MPGSVKIPTLIDEIARQLYVCAPVLHIVAWLTSPCLSQSGIPYTLFCALWCVVLGRRSYSVALTPAVVVYYDYFLTLSDEIDLFWTRRRGFGLFPFFFFLNRYVSLAGDLPIVVFGVIGETGFMVRVPARLAALKSS